MSLTFFRFIADLEQSGSQIPKAWPIILKFSLITVFYLTETENRTKISLTQLFHFISFHLNLFSVES